MTKVELVSRTQGVGIYEDLSSGEIVEAVARHGKKKDYGRLIRFLMKHKHWSPLEHVHFTFRIETARDISAQMMRHRSFHWQELCVSGGTEVTLWYPESKNSRKVKIKDLYKRYKSSYWNRGGVTPQARVYDETTKTFVAVPIKEVFKTGEKGVYRMTLSNGKSIVSTLDHKFLTKDGFKKLGELSTEDFVGSNGVVTYQNKEWLQKAKQESLSRGGLQYIADKAEVSYHTIRKWLKRHRLSYTKKEVSLYTEPWNKGVKGEESHSYGRRFSYEERMRMQESSIKGSANNLYTGGDTPWRHQVTAWVSKQKLEVGLKQGIPVGELDNYEVDHIKPVCFYPELAFDVDNLQLLTPEEHRVKTTKERLECNISPSYHKVISIEKVGVEMTYDLEVEHESHNYVADGVVTHNSQRYDKITEFMPVELRKQGKTNRQVGDVVFNPDVEEYGWRHEDDFPNSHTAQEAISHCLENSQFLYEQLLKAGVAKECARRILPMCAKTVVHMTGNLRDFIGFLNVRCERGTQKEHRNVALGIGHILEGEFPELAEMNWQEGGFI